VTGLYRIRWIPGSDTLFGVCHCGAERTAEEPVRLWDWLLAHPEGHKAAGVPHEAEPPVRPAHAGMPA